MFRYRPETTERIRNQLIETRVVPSIAAIFSKHPPIRSAAFLVAQYWSDEADDAVHPLFLFSTEPEVPPLEDCDRQLAGDTDFDGWHTFDKPGSRTVFDEFDLNEDSFSGWPTNEEAIAAFASFVREGGQQDNDISKNYSPFANFYRDGDTVRMQLVGQMWRPWLEGVVGTWTIVPTLNDIVVPMLAGSLIGAESAYVAFADLGSEVLAYRLRLFDGTNAPLHTVFGDTRSWPASELYEWLKPYAGTAGEFQEVAELLVHPGARHGFVLHARGALAKDLG